MHEIGVLYKMVEQVEKAAAAEGCRRIRAIHAEVGELSGILPVFLDRYYPVVIENREMFRGSELHYTVIPAKGLCRECLTMYDIAGQKGVCPKCGSRNKKILGGTGFILKSVEVESAEPESAEPESKEPESAEPVHGRKEP